jgi:hypothetical protein
MSAAAVTFLAWDHMVTFADEVEFIWRYETLAPMGLLDAYLVFNRSKSSNIKWSFLLLRYFTLPVLV